MNIIEIHGSNIPKKGLERFWPNEKPRQFHAVLTDANPKPAHLKALELEGAEAAKANEMVAKRIEARGNTFADLTKFLTQKVPKPPTPMERFKSTLKRHNENLDKIAFEIQEKDGSWVAAMDDEQRAALKVAIPQGGFNKLESVQETKAAMANFKAAHKKLEYELY